MKSGFMLINKPKGITSHDVVDKLRKIAGIKKIGHAGTLDPIASGLLILGIADSTKKLSKFLKQDKEYIVKIKLGAVSTTYDRDGKITLLKNFEIPSKEKIMLSLKKFKGKIKQTPPIFSAKKIKGRKYYELARKGEKFTPAPIEVEIKKISIIDYNFPYLILKVKCSSGTYIRSLADDLGKNLNCGGYVEELCRTKIGSYSLNKSVKLSYLNSKNWTSFLFNLD